MQGSGHTLNIWLAQRPKPEVRAAAAATLGLPLEVVPTTDIGLERSLACATRALAAENSGPSALTD